MPGSTASETRVAIEFMHGSQELYKSRRETGISTTVNPQN